MRHTRAYSTPYSEVLKHAIFGITMLCPAITMVGGVAEAAPSEKAKIATLERKIRSMEKRRANVQTQIDFCEHKIKLHELCRECSTGHCKSQGITGACRHWAMEPFGKKRVRVCHQLPQGSQRYSGIDQAITSLQNKIDVYQNTLDRVEEKISELETELEEARSGSADEE